MVESVVKLYSKHEVCHTKRLIIDDDFKEVEFISDPVLLRRVIGNIVKNALEACRDNETVRIGCRENGNNVEFMVHNPGAIPHDVRLQIFQRSFSTKGEGRGIGTYSVKMFTEKYLGGKVDFSSSKETGTVFKVILPLK
jgi:signal transduction histidine kinase